MDGTDAHPPTNYSKDLGDLYRRFAGRGRATGLTSLASRPRSLSSVPPWTRSNVALRNPLSDKLSNLLSNPDGQAE